MKTFFLVFVMVFFSTISFSQKITGKTFIENFYTFFLKNHTNKKLRDSLITNNFTEDLIAKLNGYKNDTIANKYITYTINTNIKDINSFEVDKYKTQKIPHVYSIFFYYNNSFLWTKVILVLKNKKWLIDKIGHFEFL